MAKLEKGEQCHTLLKKFLMDEFTEKYNKYVNFQSADLWKFNCIKVLLINYISNSSFGLGTTSFHLTGDLC